MKVKFFAVNKIYSVVACLLLAAVIGVGGFVFNKEASGLAGWGFGEPAYDDFAVRHVRQVVVKDNERGRTIMWQTDEAVGETFVEYRRKGDTEITVEAARSEQFTDGGAVSYIHTAELKQLIPNAKYEYRLGSANRRSGWHELTTAGTGSFTALIFPDSQSSDYGDWERLAQAAWRRHPQAAFFANMGDLVDNGEDPSQWNAWFEAVAGLVDTIPVAPVLGNHETYDLNWQVRMPNAYLRLFSLPDNGQARFKNQYYSFDYGDVHFIVLNTQLKEMLPLQPELLERQREWFLRDAAASDKPWKIVLTHKDVLTYEIRGQVGRQAGISEEGREFMPLFDECGIDVVLTAHLHTYRRRDHIYNFQAAAQGPLYILTGVAGNVRYPNLWVDHPLDRAVAPQPETNNYITLEADAGTLRIQSFLPSGRRIDVVELHK